MSSQNSREGIQSPLKKPSLFRAGIEVVRNENSDEVRISVGIDIDSGMFPVSSGSLRGSVEIGGPIKLRFPQNSSPMSHPIDKRGNRAGRSVKFYGIRSLTSS
ncbi:hypothetical protein AYI69_g3343 [Smittium culicis]|uniref:Uncharacterized protein n=1 Tax=Smittium culicis TaxID=133412 RepID=A0A1R1YK22_9FUNG|nr:hypothetical protein AYI69_g3343 [Smittium culicis]